MIDRVTELKKESLHICWRYKESIKTVYCLLCDQKAKRDKRKLAIFSKHGKNGTLLINCVEKI